MSLLVIFSFLVLIFSVVVHEVAHGLAALWQGDPTAKNAGRLTLNPISHIDVLGSIIVPIICVLLPGGLILGWAKPVPFNPYNLRNKRFGEALVAFAGPLSNLIIAVLLGTALNIWGGGLMDHTKSLLNVAIYTNIVLAVFNLIPLPPLDGSKILYSLFPDKMAHFMRKTEGYGIVFTIIFMIAFIELMQPVINFIYSVIV